jgi:carbon-monoxide dehydrogenase medium subunit
LKPADFIYIAPRSVEELTRIVAGRRDAADTAILAGGQSLMPLMAMRLASPACLVDINGLAGELGGIGPNGAGIRFGALVRQRAAERDAEVTRRIPLLAEALPLCAKPAIRTRGTIGGSLAYADPAAEIPVVAVALDAMLTATGPRGDRSIAAADFFTGAFQNALATDEFLTSVVFPDLPEGSGTCFMELSERHADRAAVAVAAAATLEGGIVSIVRLALAGVAPTPVRARRAEAVLAGEVPEPDALDAAAAIASEDVDPEADARASAVYRKHLTRVLARRALATAVERAGGVA